MSMELMTAINLFRNDSDNVGDLYSAPLRYLRLRGLRSTLIDLAEPFYETRPKVVVVGGGGLAEPYFAPSLSRIRSYKRCNPDVRLIAWGIGQQVSSDWRRTYRKFSYEEYFEGFDLVGIRDYGFDRQWVPCASCLSPEFDKTWEIKHEIVVFSHKQYEIPSCGFPKMTNETSDFWRVLDFLGSGETVVTSSYHGMYWALLLGRKVVAIPFNSKFVTLPYDITIWNRPWKRRSALSLWWSGSKYRNSKVFRRVRKSDIKSFAGDAAAFPAALRECRQANLKFLEDVEAII